MKMLGHTNVRLSFYLISLLIFAGLFNLHLNMFNSIDFVSEYWHFFLLGLLAATVANATGAGGGIIFLPAFLLLGMRAEEALATSFAIQCFGMTSGSLAWLNQVRVEYDSQTTWSQLSKVLLLGIVSSITGLVVAQQVHAQPPFNLHHFFSYFSIAVGGLILHRALNLPNKEVIFSSLSFFQANCIVISCLIGGAITAWLSIGVGEILAVVLLVLKFNVRFAITAAVCVSAVTVLAGLPFHLWVGDRVNFAVLQFAAPGAIVGGFVARYLAIMVSPLNLKIVMSIWIILSGFLYLFIN